MIFDHIRADVRGHHDDRIAKIHFASLRIAQVTFFHNLQQHVVNFGMRLFDFIKNDDRVWAAAQGFGQLPRILVANVSRRRAHQTGGGVTFHKLGHIQLNGGFFTAKHELGEGLCQLGLANACGSEEHERTNRALWVFQASARAAHGAGNGNNRIFLTNDVAAKFIFHFEQAL